VEESEGLARGRVKAGPRHKNIQVLGKGQTLRTAALEPCNHVAMRIDDKDAATASLFSVRLLNSINRSPLPSPPFHPALVRQQVHLAGMFIELMLRFPH
jgi:hypothetical protein